MAPTNARRLTAAAAVCLVLLAAGCKSPAPPKKHDPNGTKPEVLVSQDDSIIKKAPTVIPANFRLPWQTYAPNGKKAQAITLSRAEAEQKQELQPGWFERQMPENYSTGPDLQSTCDDRKKAAQSLASSDLLGAYTVARQKTAITPDGDMSYLVQQPPKAGTAADAQKGWQTLYLFKDQKTASTYVDRLRKAVHTCPVIKDYPSGKLTEGTPPPITGPGTGPGERERSLTIARVIDPGLASPGATEIRTYSVHASAVLQSGYDIGVYGMVSDGPPDLMSNRPHAVEPATPENLATQGKEWVRHIQEAPDNGSLHAVDAWLCAFSSWECVREYEPMGPYEPGSPGEKQETPSREVCRDLIKPVKESRPSLLTYISPWAEEGPAIPQAGQRKIRFKIINATGYTVGTPVPGGCVKVRRLELHANEYQTMWCPETAIEDACEAPSKWEMNKAKDGDHPDQRNPAYYGHPHGWTNHRGFLVLPCPEDLPNHNCDSGYADGPEPEWYQDITKVIGLVGAVADLVPVRGQGVPDFPAPRS